MIAHVTTPLARLAALLADSAPAGPTGATFSTVWELLETLVNDCGARLSSHPDGPFPETGTEVLLYLGNLERVAAVAAGSPFTLPHTVRDLLQATGRYLVEANTVDEYTAFLEHVPHLVESIGTHLTRTNGIQAAPLAWSLELAVRAGGVYRDALAHALPVGAGR